MSFVNKQQQLMKRNEELEAKKRAIMAQLEGSNPKDSNSYDYQERDDNNIASTGDGDSDGNMQLDPPEDGPPEDGEDDEQSKDIIGMLETVKKAQQEKAQTRMKELKKVIDANRGVVTKNREKISRLQANIEQAQVAVNIKNQLKQELESKGRKVSDESKKWIAQVAKLHDKAQQLKGILMQHQKDQEGVTTQQAVLERKITDLIREKNSYDSEVKHLAAKSEQLKQEIENAKGVLRQRQLQAREDTNKKLKTQQKGYQQIKRLERQRNELLKAYKKLTQYIAVLRKINLHLETGSELGFTLKEYLQAVDKGELALG